jgi:O-antigen/teichoic acid export membrane protein
VDSIGVTTPTEAGGLRRSAWALGSRIAAAAAFAGVSAVLSRRLGPAGFGTFSVAVSVGLAGSFVASGGMNRVLLRDVAAALARDNRSRAATLIRDGLRTLVASMPAGGVLTALIAALLLHDGWQLVAAVALFALAQAVLLVTSDLLRALGEVRLANLSAGRSGGAAVLVPFLLLILAAGTWLDATRTIALYLITAALVGLISWFVLAHVRRRLGAPEPIVRMRTIGLAAGMPFALTQVALFMSTQVDLWVAQAVFDGEDLGLYAAALRVMSLVSLPLQSAQLAMVAGISALYALGRTQELERRVRRAAALVAVPAGALLVVCIVAAPLVLTVVFGSDFEEGAPALAILATGELVNVLSGLCGIVLAMSGHERLVLVVTLIGVTAAAAADVIGANLGGITGLAIGSAVTTAGLYVALWAFARSRVGVWTHPSLKVLRSTPEPAT